MSEPIPVHSITVQFDVAADTARRAAEVLCDILVGADLVAPKGDSWNPVESWSMPYFPEVDRADARDFPDTDRRSCGCPFDYHLADCPIRTDRSGESEEWISDEDGDRPERIPVVECRYCKRHLDPDYEDDWEARICEECSSLPTSSDDQDDTPSIEDTRSLEAAALDAEVGL